MQLRELQTEFAKQITGAASNDLLSKINSIDIEAARRVQVYRNNIHSTLVESLQSIYPVVQSIVGEEFFKQTARKYIETHSSTSGDLREYGEKLPNLLESLEQLNELRYLSDIARIEWLCHVSWYAENAESISIERLQSIETESYQNIQLVLHPSVYVLKSEFPVFKIWEFCLDEQKTESSKTIDVNSGSQCVLVKRDGHEVKVYHISDDLHCFISMLSQGGTLGQLISQLMETNADFDLAKSLHQVFALGTIYSLTIHGN